MCPTFKDHLQAQDFERIAAHNTRSQGNITLRYLCAMWLLVLCCFHLFFYTCCGFSFVVLVCCLCPPFFWFLMFSGMLNRFLSGWYFVFLKVPGYLFRQLSAYRKSRPTIQCAEKHTNVKLLVLGAECEKTEDGHETASHSQDFHGMTPTSF